MGGAVGSAGSGIPEGEGAPPKSATECIHIWFNLYELTSVIIRVFEAFIQKVTKN